MEAERGGEEPAGANSGSRRSTGRVALTKDRTLLAFTAAQDGTGVADETTISLRGVGTIDSTAGGDYTLQAESGLGPQEDAETLTLKQDAAIVKWLEGNRDALVREEMALREPIAVRQHLDAELDQRKVVLCVPMILDGRLVERLVKRAGGSRAIADAGRADGSGNLL